ncbi:MAG: immunoglobulin domain-containing protein [Verrucomicrobia bacterium]|nr:immunoglobulin domain-containing protein [Verrucomicrobiota bacterium]
MKKFFAISGVITVLILGFILLTWPGSESDPSPGPVADEIAATPMPEPSGPPVAAINHVAVPTPVRTEERRLISQEQQWREVPREGAFAAFHEWTEKYIHAPTAQQKTALVEEGVVLASERRMALLDFIRNDPEQALQQAVPFGVRRAMPPEVAKLLEEQISGRGQLALLAALPEPGKEAITTSNFRTVTIDERTFGAHVYGWRLGEPTRNNIPLHGIAVGDDMAVSSDPLRLLDQDEAAEIQAVAAEPCPNTIADPEPEVVAVAIGARVEVLCCNDHGTELNDRLVAAENGPPDPDLDSFDPQPSAYTEGNKNIIMIRIDFPDLAGVPVADSTASTIVTSVNNFYTELSYGRVSFSLVGQGSVITPTFRMPNSASYYGTNNHYVQVRNDARTAAAAAGYVLTNYQFDVICMGLVPGFTWAGLGYVGQPGSWIRASYATHGGVTAHELGHNFGLNHANFWDTGGSSVIGSGASVEYGDIFENMGSSSSIPNGHHNVRYKNYANWLTSSEVQTVTSNNTYRIAAHDNPNSTGLRGLRIVKNSSTNYWVEFRQKFTANKWLMNGGVLRWAQNGNQKSHLLDTTPGTSDGRTNAALLIGRTFSDKQAGIHITPIGKGGTAPESLDVRINLGTFPGNLPPTVSISASATNASAGQTLTFTASASDPNGDALAYYWDFGDGNFGNNSPAASKSWAATGEYLVRCEVTDMKGGVGSAWVIVRVGSPSTFRISGTVTASGSPVQGVRVFASTTRMAWTDSDGNYSIVGLPAGTYTVNASLDGYLFVPFSFSNPVPVGPNVSNANFIDAQGMPFITKQPASQTNFVGATLLLSADVAGADPLRYQWQFQNAPINGATNSNYLISDAQVTNAGAYRLVVTNHLGGATSVVANVTIQNSAIIQALFADTFDSDTGANWITNRSSTDTRVTFHYNYANDGIPPAPYSSGNTTRGVKFEANMNNTVAAAINVSPVGQNFTGDYRLRFDMWINANGPFPGGGTGSTEHLTAGVGTAGNRVQWSSGNADGYWFAVSGEGGATATTTILPDFAALSGTGMHSAASGVYAAGTASNPRDNAHVYYANTFPGGQTPPLLQRNSHAQQTGTLSQGTAGFVWRDVLINKTGSTVEWFIDGLKIATITGAGAASTNIFVGYWDGFNSRSDNNALSFGLVDNVRVERTVFFPIITSHATNRTVVAGQNTTFAVTATGTSPSYQWQFNGTNIVGATFSSYTLINVQPIHAGSYSVLVSNAADTVSSTAELTVLQPPTITAQPVAQSVFVGANAFFTVGAEGSGTLSYQWRRNGTNLVGQTTSQLQWSNVQFAEAGDYTVAITNSVGNVTSAAASLTVNAWTISGASADFSGGQFGFTFSGAAGYLVIIEGSSNLEHWTPLHTNTFGSEPLAFSDPESSSSTNRFYRFRNAE